MTIIAVAGGTGGVGRTIVETLVQHAKHQVILLTRGVPKSDPLLDKIKQVQVGYNDATALARTLDQHEVHTIISAIGIVSDETSQSQLTLINAAAQSSATKRFIPSEYSFIQTEDLLSIDPSIKYWLAAAELLKKTTLQFTRIIPGFFMDYWGMPAVRTNLQPFTFGIDIASCQAAIPGDGNDVICMTYTYDMAAFIVRLLDEEDWPEFSKKFQVVYDSVDKIKEGDVTIPPMPSGTGYSVEELKETTTLVSRLTIAGVFDLPRENRLNARFPDIETTKLKALLEKAWGNYQ
ncbi:hypothetical protein BDV33DRAFT_200992 [Aspergillus novoparasiticus]|uniref:NAD(P)-binding domain-containing protein n=1 Tax=Aspergillus novoparasiticus TaxID=986946 RepID=A0A5N6F254_9EURO|nr:hypothetical protein BDV33DRAFT_200992 [Aspergillus novoparasiticus]